MFWSAGPQLTLHFLGSRQEEGRAPPGEGGLAVQKQSWAMKHLNGLGTQGTSLEM